MQLVSKTLRKYSKTPKLTKCVFREFDKLAQFTGAINLGAGTPSGNPATFITDAFKKYSSLYENNHNTHQCDILNRKLSTIYTSRSTNKLHPTENIIVTVGAREALTSILNAFLSEGDQALVFDPSYESYRKGIQETGAKAVSVQLIPRKFQSKTEIYKKGPKYMSNDDDNWEIDFKGLSSSINHKTKVLLINSPHNPTGKIFSKQQVKQICKILQRYPKIIVVDDRVYEHSHYDRYIDTQVPKISDIAAMKNRTLSVYSGGKLLRVDGLRCGWIVGPQNLIKQVNLIDPPPKLTEELHLAVSQSLEVIYAKQNNYLNSLKRQLINSRRLLLDSLIHSKYDFNLWIPEGGYFILADISKIELQDHYYYHQNAKLTKDYAFCVKLCKQEGVASIPCSGFFEAQQKLSQNLIRFAFCKDQKEIVQAGRRLKSSTVSIVQ